MKIKLNQNDTIKLEKLLETSEYNKDISDFYVTLLNDLKDEIVDELEGRKNIEAKDIFKLVTSMMEIDDKNTINILKSYKVDNFLKQNNAVYEQNNFNKFFSAIKNKKSKMFEICSEIINPYELFLLKDIDIDSDFKEITTLGYFEKPYRYISIKKDDVTWMSTVPHEINTMQNNIDEAKGDVLVLGLGLGYFPFMISSKDDVKSITIVELDKDLINFFKDTFKDIVSNKKITIINADAVEYMKNLTTKYDYIYADLWHDAEDGFELYSKLKIVEFCSDFGKINYWIEDTMLALARRLTFSYLYENYYKISINYSNVESVFDLYIKTLHDELKNKVINTYDDILEILSDSNLKSTISKMRF